MGGARWILAALAAVVLAGCGGFTPKKSASLTISPKLAAVKRDTVQNFSYAIETTGNPAVRWVANGGSITQSGNFRGPAFDGVFDVRVESIEDPSLAAEAVIAVGDNNSGAIAPADPKIGVGESVALTASFTDVTNDACDFLTTGGTMVPIGTTGTLFTAPDTPGTITVIARNRQNKQIFGKVVVEVRNIDLTVSPNGLAVAPGSRTTFTAAVTGPSDTGVVWSASGGAITTAGEWTAPAVPGEYTITATSRANPKFTGQSLIFVR